MKKIAILSLCAFLFLNSTVYASGGDKAKNEKTEDAVVSKVSFDNIEEEILKRNMTVKINKNTLDTLAINYDELDETRESLNNGIEGLVKLLDAYRAEAGVSGSVKRATSTDGGTDQAIDEINDTLDLVNQTNMTLIKLEIGAFAQQVDGIEDKEKDLKIAIKQMGLQSEMTNYQMVWSAESLISANETINEQEQNIDNNKSVLQEQLKALKVQKALGIVTNIDVNTMEVQIESLDFAKKTLESQKVNIKRQLNLLLGQDCDTNLEIDSKQELDKDKLKTINKDADLQTALNNSYAIDIQDYAVDRKREAIDYADDDKEAEVAQKDLETEQLKLDDTKRQTALTFQSIYDEVMTKKDTLTLEEKKLENEKTNLYSAQLKFSLGLISNLNYSSLKTNYYNQVVKVETAKADLLKSYKKYEWMLKGVVVK